MDFLQAPSGIPWLTFALLFVGVILMLNLLRQLEAWRVERKFSRSEILLASFEVNLFTRLPSHQRPCRRTGSLVLLAHGLFFHSRFLPFELYIPAHSIVFVGVVEPKRSLVIHHLTDEGREQRSLFRVPLPEHWAAAVKTRLLNHEHTVRRPD